MGDTENEVELNPSDNNVLDKYKFAAKVVNAVLGELVEKCVAGASVKELCFYGDEQIEKQTSEYFKTQKKIKNGIAFPTCISVNNVICHFSPITEEHDIQLKDDDVVKIDLGAHVDGFPAIVGHTMVIGASEQKPVTGRRADAMVAASKAFDAVLKCLKPGNENTEASKVADAITNDYNCKLIEGIACHRMRQNTYDCDKSIIFNPNEEQRKTVEKCTFDRFECWLIDVIVSTGEGKTINSADQPTVFHKTDNFYSCKLKTSREILSKLDLHGFPFNIKVIQDQSRARLAMKEFVDHNLMQPFPVLTEKSGETVVQMKSTVLLMKNAVTKLVGPAFVPKLYKSELKVNDADAKNILNRSMKYEANTPTLP